LYSINELMTLTGKSFRTIKKRLESITPEQENGNCGTLYDLRKVLPLLYRPSAEPKSLTDYRILRDKSEARLAEAKAQKLRLEVGLMKKKLVPLEIAEKEWAALVSTFRSRMLALPSRASLIVHDLETPQEIEMTLKEFIHEALTELSSNASITSKEFIEHSPLDGTSSKVKTD